MITWLQHFYCTHGTRVLDSGPYLMAGRGYTVGIAYMSFFGQLRSLPAVDPSGMPQMTVVALKGLGLVLACTCLADAVERKRDLLSYLVNGPVGTHCQPSRG